MVGEPYPVSGSDSMRENGPGPGAGVRGGAACSMEPSPLVWGTDGQGWGRHLRRGHVHWLLGACQRRAGDR